MIDLTLTDAQAEMLGYALTKAKLQEQSFAAMYDQQGSGCHAASCRERIRRIEELRMILDRAPVTA